MLLLLPKFWFPFYFPSVDMNMLIWNCRGALKPNFFSLVSDLIHKHHPAILVIMETKVSGDRARSIVDRLPMDGAILVNNIGLTGGLWVLWDSTHVNISELATTEQEVHALVNFNSPTSQGPWLLLQSMPAQDLLKDVFCGKIYLLWLTSIIYPGLLPGTLMKC